MIFFFILISAVSPITRAEYPYPVQTMSESDGQDAAFRTADAEVTLLRPAMSSVVMNEPMRIEERLPGGLERNPVLGSIQAVLLWVPFETEPSHLQYTPCMVF